MIQESWFQLILLSAGGGVKKHFINCAMLSEIRRCTYYDRDGREPPPQIYDSDSLTIKSQQLSVWCVKAVEPSQAAPVQSKQLHEHWASRITLTL